MKKPSSGGNVEGIGLEGSKTSVGILCLYKTPNLHGLILEGKTSSGRSSNLVFLSLPFGRSSPSDALTLVIDAITIQPMPHRG